MLRLYTQFPQLLTEYFELLPQIMFLASLVDITFRQLGFDVPPFNITEVLPFMYEGIIVAFNGVRK
ncbi:hypothetical protein [Salmonella phage STWB21]|uniref:Uncharacterized protein n=1 Tax=Salmonella phage STWB21 TaxID=2815768 RepID=A0A8A6RGN5_9CAUD|nr:hypothetical protein [Salmonella phage STWB21]